MRIKSKFLLNNGTALALIMLVGGSSGAVLRANVSVKEGLIVTQTGKTVKGLVTIKMENP